MASNPNNPYEGVTLVAAPGLQHTSDPYAGVTASQVQLPNGPVDMGPQSAPPGVLEQLARAGYNDITLPAHAAQSVVGSLAGSAAHLAGSVASDTGLASPGAGARWDAATQRWMQPPQNDVATSISHGIQTVMDPRYNPVTAAAQSAGNAIDRNAPAGVTHAINDYVAPALNIATAIYTPEFGEAAGLGPKALEEGAPGTESAVARSPNAVSEAAGMGKSPSLQNRPGSGEPSGTFNRVVESSTGSKAGFADEVSARNEQRVNAGINFDLGIPPGTPTSRNAIITAQVPLKAGFNRLENVPGQITLDPAFHQDMAGVGESLATLPKTPGVDELRETAGKPGVVDAPTLIKTVQTARARGSALMNSDDPSQVELGKAYLGVARAYENQFGRYLQNNPQFGVDPQSWRQLSTAWAKNQLALEAYKGGETGGSYDAKVFANAGGKNGEPLDGFMKLFADLQPQAAENFKLGKTPAPVAVPVLGGGVGSLLAADMLIHGRGGAAAAIAGSAVGLGALRQGLRRAALGPVLNPQQASEEAAQIAADPRLSYYFAGREPRGVPAPGPGTPPPGAPGAPFPQPGGPPQIPGAIATPAGPMPPRGGGTQFNPDAYANAVRGPGQPLLGPPGGAAQGPVSQEFVNSQRQLGTGSVETTPLHRLDPDGNSTPVTGVEARDPRSVKGQPVVNLKTGEIIDRGGLTTQQVKALITRAKTPRLGHEF